MLPAQLMDCIKICESVRAEFSLTNALISNMKKKSLKSRIRLHLSKTMHPNIPLPPESVPTRWGTWIKAAEYYSDNFLKIVEVLEELDDDAVESIRQEKEFVKNPDSIAELTVIKMHYVFLAETITKLESANITLQRSLSLVTEAETTAENVPHEKIRAKLKAVLQKNVGLKALSALNGSNSYVEVQKFQ